MINRLIEAWRESRELKAKVAQEREEVRKKEALVKRHYDLALAFNDLHCHTGDDMWMCPICNKVHGIDVKDTRLWQFLTGRHYPRCCDLPKGHRLFYTEHATTGNTTK